MNVADLTKLIFGLKRLSVELLSLRNDPMTELGLRESLHRILAALYEFIEIVLTAMECGALNRQQLLRAEMLLTRTRTELAELLNSSSLEMSAFSCARQINSMSSYVAGHLSELAESGDLRQQLSDDDRARLIAVRY